MKKASIKMPVPVVIALISPHLVAPQQSQTPSFKYTILAIFFDIPKHFIAL